MKKHVPLILILSFGFLFVGHLYSGDISQRDILTQYSTINALLGGVYDGEMTIKDLKRHGDFGLGTFNALDGEMFVVDGHYYQITSDGKAREADEKTRTPFAAVTFFESDKKADLHSDMDFDSFTRKIDETIITPNIFYAIKIKGKFKAIKTRSVPKQVKPYKPLKEIVDTQPIFYFSKTRGTIVGFRCPSYVKNINVPGYHLHFITEDCKAGGHVLDFVVDKAVLEIDETSGFSLLLPQNKAFYNSDLSLDKQSDLEKVEK
ncbi:MAG: acetolactate decarboxylase [Pseudomonadota bacterium]